MSTSLDWILFPATEHTIWTDRILTSIGLIHHIIILIYMIISYYTMNSSELSTKDKNLHRLLVYVRLSAILCYLSLFTEVFSAPLSSVPRYDIECTWLQL